MRPISRVLDWPWLIHGRRELHPAPKPAGAVCGYRAHVPRTRPARRAAVLAGGIGSACTIQSGHFRSPDEVLDHHLGHGVALDAEDALNPRRQAASVRDVARPRARAGYGSRHCWTAVRVPKMYFTTTSTCLILETVTMAKDPRYAPRMLFRTLAFTLSLSGFADAPGLFIPVRRKPRGPVYDLGNRSIVDGSEVGGRTQRPERRSGDTL